MARSKLHHILQAVSLAALLFAGPALGAEVSSTAKYVVTLSGVNIADVGVKLNDDGQHYSLDLDATVAGLGQLVASGTASVNVSGVSGGNRLGSEKFALQTVARGETFSIKIQYARGNVSSFIVDPPITNNIDRIPIERSQLSGVGDMLSAFVIKGGTLDKSLCDRKMQIFTGVERFAIGMRFNANDTATSPRTGYQGPVVLCQIRYTPISGHFTTSEMTNYLANSDHILIWYAPMGTTGYFIPYRVLLTTSVGDLSMVLTSLSD
ncbi:MAG TPA: DUF3108 domain-containing protein [Arsenicitalea sp.]|nr:DUF3108 domain-containing protein [Arsenicitalea sp.]